MIHSNAGRLPVTSRDEAMMIDDECLGRLCGVLTRVAADPARVEALREELGAYCHRLRNLLNALKMSLYLAVRSIGDPAADERWRTLDDRYREAEAALDDIQSIWSPIRLSTHRHSLDQVLEERRARWLRPFHARGAGLELIGPDGPTVGVFDAGRLLQAIDRWVAWRCRSARVGDVARFAWRVEGPDFVLDWHEPDPTEPEVFTDAGSSSLALPMLTRIVSAHGGHVAVSSASGLSLRLRWPREADTPEPTLTRPVGAPYDALVAPVDHGA